jgi:lysophospholipid acyltransferase (LPLAT)-like uncharacterized protein
MIKRFLQHPRIQTLLAVLLGGYLDFALRTTRWTVVGQEAFAPFEHGAPVIAAFWHEHLPLMPALYLRARRSTPALRMHVLVSRSRDGRFIGAMMARFGLSVAHGSTSRGGAAGLRELLSVLDAGQGVVITPDGPRGPRRQAALGVAQLAGLSGVPILPCAASATRMRRLGSWDRMMLPLPWGRGVLVCRPVIALPREGWEAGLDAVVAAMNEASAVAEAWAP